MENLYNLIPKQPVEAIHPERYVSKFRETVLSEEKAPRRDHQSLGLASYNDVDPKNYLKKTEKRVIKQNEAPKSNLKNVKSKLKVELPDKKDQPVHGLKTKKNYILQNAAENIMSVPKKPHKYRVDQRNGAKFPLEPSGLELHHATKSDYGQVPLYLKQRKEQIEQAQQQYEAYMKEMKERNALHQMTVEERQSLLDGLRSNWQSFYKMYQGLSVMVDTVPKKNRKEWLENEMKALEKDIEMIERHEIILLKK